VIAQGLDYVPKAVSSKTVWGKLYQQKFLPIGFIQIYCSIETEIPTFLHFFLHQTPNLYLNRGVLSMLREWLQHKCRLEEERIYVTLVMRSSPPTIEAPINSWLYASTWIWERNNRSWPSCYRTSIGNRAPSILQCSNWANGLGTLKFKGQRYGVDPLGQWQQW